MLLSTTVPRLSDVSHTFLDASLEIHVVERTHSTVSVARAGGLIESIATSTSENRAMDRSRSVLVCQESSLLRSWASLVVDHTSSLLSRSESKASIASLSILNTSFFLIGHNVSLVAVGPEALEVGSIPEVDGDPHNVAFFEVNRLIRLITATSGRGQVDTTVLFSRRVLAALNKSWLSSTGIS